MFYQRFFCLQRKLFSLENKYALDNPIHKIDFIK